MSEAENELGGLLRQELDVVVAFPHRGEALRQQALLRRVQATLLEESATPAGLAFAVSQGIPEERICLDPGIGFGKTVEQNFELVRRLDVVTALGRPVVVGFSRKSSLGRILGDPAATTGPLSACSARWRSSAAPIYPAPVSNVATGGF